MLLLMHIIIIHQGILHTAHSVYRNLLIVFVAIIAVHSVHTCAVLHDSSTKRIYTCHICNVDTYILTYCECIKLYSRVHEKLFQIVVEIYDLEPGRHLRVLIFQIFSRLDMCMIIYIYILCYV